MGHAESVAWSPPISVLPGPEWALVPPVEMITFEHIKKKPVLHAVLALPCIVSLTVLSVRALEASNLSQTF